MVSARRAMRPIVAIYPAPSHPACGATGDRGVALDTVRAVRRAPCVPCGTARRRARPASHPHPSPRRPTLNGKRRAAGPAEKQPKAAGGRRRRRLRRVVKWLLVVGLVGALVLAAGLVDRSTRAPTSRTRTRTSRPRRRSSTTPTARPSSASSRRRTASRSRSSEMPQNIQDAVVAAENRTFWTDKGIDPKGILRAAFSNARGNSTQGASTITQQYVKILYLTQERSLTAQGEGGDPVAEDPEPAEQVADPRGLPQHHLLRPRRLRHPGGGAGVLRRRRQGPHAASRPRCWPAC